LRAEAELPRKVQEVGEMRVARETREARARQRTPTITALPKLRVPRPNLAAPQANPPTP
jgi:hypothetical protein